MAEDTCVYVRPDGSRCASTIGIDLSGLCHVHQPGGSERQRAASVAGGRARAIRDAGAAFDATEIPPLESLEDAKLALDAIRVAVLSRRITHAEGSSATRTVEAWVKAEGAALTAKLVGEIRRELDAKQLEIDALRAQLSGKGRAPRRKR